MRDLSGEKFGLLFVEGRDTPHTSPSGVKRTKWKCRCECGKNVSVFQFNLVGGKSTSCGCKSSKAGAARFLKHGGKRTRLYNIWMSMKHRCSDVNDKNYGGRGISVCEAWHEFVPFRDWALSNGYRPTLTIDRLDNSGGYSPDNCAWKTHREQSQNRRSNRPVIRSDGARYGTIQAAAADNGCSARNIGHVLAGVTRTAVGFGWSYDGTAA